MIRSATAHNFESHQDTTLEFHPGVNVLIGSSDSGKTAFIHSLYWNRYNRPLGNTFISWSNQNDKGTPIGETSSTIVVENEGESHSIKRVRSPKLNGYVIDDLPPLEAIGSGEPPAQVLDLLNLSDVNFSMQMDPHFLISKSPGEIAKYLNTLVHLDDIDTSIAVILSMQKSNKKELIATDKEIETLAKEKEKFTWLERANALLEQAEALQKKIDDLTTKRDRIDALCSTARANKGKIDVLAALLKKITPYMDRIDFLHQEIAALSTKKNKLSTCLRTVQAQLNTVTTTKKEYERLEKLLPPICPECGKPL